MIASQVANRAGITDGRIVRRSGARISGEDRDVLLGGCRFFAEGAGARGPAGQPLIGERFDNERKDEQQDEDTFAGKQLLDRRRPSSRFTGWRTSMLSRPGSTLDGNMLTSWRKQAATVTVSRVTRDRLDGFDPVGMLLLFSAQSAASRGARILRGEFLPLGGGRNPQIRFRQRHPYRGAPAPPGNSSSSQPARRPFGPRGRIVGRSEAGSPAGHVDYRPGA